MLRKHLALLSAGLCLFLSTPVCFGGSINAQYNDLDSSTAINLSAEGTLDWALWGLDGPQAGSTIADSRKASGSVAVGMISELTELNSDITTDGGGWEFSPLWSWSGGIGISSSGSGQHAALMSRNNGLSSGFSLSIPADTSSRTVRVYVAGWNADATFTALLSDGSAADYIYSDFTAGSFDRVGVFRVDYSASSGGQTLDVRFEMTADAGSNESVSICAVTLAPYDNQQPIPEELEFESPVNIASVTQGGAISLASGDLNNDGQIELISTATRNSVQPHFRIYRRNLSNDTWSIINVLSQSAVSARRDRFGGDSYIADMNNDGWDDIILPESNNSLGSGLVSWFENPKRNDLGGVWTEHVITTWPGSGTKSHLSHVRHMSEIYAGDIDNDGDMDVITRDVQYGLFVLVNNGYNPALASTFDRRHIPCNPREGLALFDPDNDGDLDILINGVWFETPSDPLNGYYAIHHIKKSSDSASPWYPASNNSDTQNDYACKVFAADFNNDGLDDVAITNSEELSTASSAVKPEGLWVYLADDDSGDLWTEVIIRNYGSHLHTLHADDIDLDGDIDILSGVSTVGTGSNPADIFVYLNDGSGLNWSYKHVENLNIYSGIMADADNDGDVDIIGEDNWSSGPIRLIKTIAPDPQPQLLPGDADADLDVDIFDFLILRANYGSIQASWQQGDFDGDGSVNILDFLILKANFGTSL